MPRSPAPFQSLQFTELFHCPAPGWGNIVTASGLVFIHPDKIGKGLFLLVYFFFHRAWAFCFHL